MLAALILGWVTLSLIGCGRAGPAPPPVSARDDDAATQATLDAVSAAVLRGDRAAFTAAVDPTDPAFAPLAGRLYGLARLPLRELRLQLRGPRTALAANRRATLGARAWHQRVTVRWRLTDDRGVAEHVLDLAFRHEGGRIRLAGAGERANQVAVPLWWQQNVALRRAERVTVIAPDNAAAAAWLLRGRAAVAAVAARLPTGLSPGWRRSLVIEVPTTRQGFARVLGVDPRRYAEIAAVTWPEGPDPADAAVRVVVNPGVSARLDATSLAVLLAHEVVHVATRSAASPAPTWLVEGYADYLAYDAYPAAEPIATRALLSGVRVSGPPQGLSADADFGPDAPGLSREYALAWDLCRFIAADTSPAALGRLYRRADAGADLDASVGPALRTDAATLTARWRRNLIARAQGS